MNEKTDTCPDCSSIPCHCEIPAGYTPTPRTDFAIKASNGQWSYVLKLCSERLERELTAAREEIKETQKHLKDANRGAEINAHALRINADKLIAVTEQLKQALEELTESQKDYKCLAELLNGHDATECRMNLVNLKQDIKTVTEQRDKYHDYWESFGEERIKLKTELATVTEQRDRLAEACSPSFDTTETDAAWSAHCIDPDSASGDPWDLAKKLETELTTVTEQRDELLRYNKAFRQDTLICADCDAISKEEYDRAIEQRDGLRSAVDYASDQLTRVTEQRDRLAEALENNWELLIALHHYFDADYPIDVTLIHHAAKLTREALQSLNPDHAVEPNDMIAAVKGGADDR